MRNVHSKSFMAAWHLLLQTTSPSATVDVWDVDGVTWKRSRHGNWCPDYSFQMDVHVLELPDRGRRGWLLLVAVERWWDAARKDGFRATEWSRVMRGDPKHVLSWFQMQAAKRGFE